MLTINDDICGDASNIVLWQNEDKSSQKWVMHNDNTIESVQCPGMVLSLADTLCADGTFIVLSSKISGGSDYQAWILNYSSGTIVNTVCNTKGIDISDGSVNNGVEIILWQLHADWNQHWDLLSVSTTTSPTIPPTYVETETMPSVAP